MNFFQFLYEFITITDLKQKEIEEKAQIILAKYSGDYSNLYNLIKYDKPDCSIEERRKSFRTLMPCSIPQILKALSEVRYKFLVLLMSNEG